ncbi:chemotaxis protein CheW [Nodosilinea sp. E11]|uniref:chemotaxis protein CheW n=1 Tax=Nodosilinea sp. E11 TaxID=3037479 RepID=UPI002934AFEF|nr:chemotaxis protein CheW [Nodosilinea sp. E11]WOD40478.1 chemotaxis protein CheW [Nodosilinea sp. E11]
MNDTAYLLFTLGDNIYGLAAERVEEIFLLPALVSVPEAGPEVAGVLNLRGQLLTVLNLGVHLGYASRPNTLSQAVILAKCGSQRLGLVVDDIQSVTAIAASQRSTALETPYLAHTEQSLTVGVAQHHDTIIVLLNPDALEQRSLNRPQTVAQGGGNRFMAQFCAADQQVLQARAAGLAQRVIEENASDGSALAVVSLEGEHFALELKTVHEFTEVPHITPIPCCPPHIVGNMNLRGEILTLVDVRRFFNLRTSTGPNPQKAVVMRLGSLVAGVIVDDVFDVVYLQASEITAMPTALHSADNPYLRGVTRFDDRLISILDLPKLLTQGELVVDQAS